MLNEFDTPLQAVSHYEVGRNKEGEMHGEGVLTYSNGEQYIGSFVNNKKSGKGVLFLSEESDYGVYSGQFVDDKMHGKGVLTYSHKERYIGGFKEGEMHGKGSYYYEDGGIYIGYFDKNTKSGEGEFIYPDKSRYIGLFLNDEKHGNGDFVYSTGERYYGEFKRGKFHGEGIFCYSDGGCFYGKFDEGKEYEGEFYGGKSDGDVKIHYGDCVYKGGVRELRDDETFDRHSISYVVGFENRMRILKKHGKGIETYSNGDRYEGEFSDGFKYGKGIETYSNGDRYEGEFSDNVMQGKGTLRLNNGEVFTGHFEKGAFSPEIVSKNRGEKRSVINFIGLNSAHSSRVIESAYENSVVKEIRGNTKGLLSGESNRFIKNNNIKEYISKTKDGNSQVVVHITSHANREGVGVDAEEICNFLSDLGRKINSYNKSHYNKLIKKSKIIRVKINLGSCYGDKSVMEGSLKDVILELASSGLDVRISSVSAVNTASSIISNGKNCFPCDKGRLESERSNIEIIERVFSVDKKVVDEFKESKEGKYSNIIAIKKSLNGSDIYIAAGVKEYESSKDFFEDKYRNSESKADERGDFSGSKALGTKSPAVKNPSAVVLSNPVVKGLKMGAP